MAVSSSYKILSINDLSDEYVELEKLFRNKGKVVRSEIVRDIQSIPSMLNEHDYGACLVYEQDGGQAETLKIIELIFSTDASVPIIVLSNDVDAFIKNKAVFHCIPPRESEQLIIFCLHAFAICDLNSQLLESQQKAHHLQEQVNLLLSDSDDGIAYVSGGMLIKSNEIFASQFGFDDPEELDYFPLFDLIEANDHESLKQALMVTADDVTTVMVSNEIGKELSFECSAVVVDDEPCTQIRSTAETVGALGLTEEQLLCMQLDKCLSNIKIKQYSAFYFELEAFNLLRAQHGYSALKAVNEQLLVEFEAIIENVVYLNPYNNTGFVGIVEADQASVIENFQRLFDTINNKKIVVDGQQISVRFSHAGGVELNLRSPKESIEIVNQLIASYDAVNDQGHVVNFNGGESVVTDISNLSDEELLLQLNNDIENNKLSLLYHPVINLRGGDFDFYEVLLAQATDNSLDQIDAGYKYLQSLNFSEPNTRLDHWIIIESTKVLASKADDFTDVRILINLSVNALRDTQLASWLSVVIKASDIEPSSLVLQFDSRDITVYLGDAIRLSKELNDLGFGFSVSQFDEESLNNIKQLPAEFVKLSDDLTDDITATDSEVIKKLVTELNESSVNPIIPNIMQAAALAMLWQVGAKYIQGSYLADPMPAMDYEFTDIA